MAETDTQEQVAFASADATVIANKLHDIADAIREFARTFAEPELSDDDTGSVPFQHMGQVA